MWRLWKIRNKLICDGLILCGLDTLEKIHDESSQWFTDQVHEHQHQGNGSTNSAQTNIIETTRSRKAEVQCEILFE